MRAVSFRWQGREIYAARGDSAPRAVDVHQFFRINGVLCMSVGIRPEHDDQLLVVDVVTCSPAFALETSLFWSRQHPGG